MRRLVVASLSCALLSAAMLAGQAPQARASVSGRALVDDARSYIGTPYDAAYGFDCSGFTSAVFADLGVYLPDSPEAQHAYGVPSDAEAGDLVFFDEDGYGISHVGIATGYGTVIHSSSYYGAVVETPVGYIPGYVGAVDAY
jgi:cell wall-associated NlpC family hydrolase